MENLIIGEDPINLTELVELIENSPFFPKLVKNWNQFVSNLKMHDCITNGDLKTMLSCWSAEKGRGATLSGLCEAFNSCLVGGIAELLEKKYWLVAIKSLKLVIPGGKHAGLEEATQLISVEKYRKIYNAFKTTICTQPIELLGIHVIPNVEADERYSYYIPRTLRRRTQVDENIFTDPSMKNDLLLVKGIQKDELEKVSGYQHVDVTGNQRDNITVHLMVLEQDDDFNYIRKKAQVPVHLIEFKNGSFFWIKSSKEIASIQRFIRESEDNFSEDEVIEKTMKTPFPRATIISDSAGMGKSLLLQNLAQKLQERNKSTVIYINLREFAKIKPTRTYSVSWALAAIAEYACANDLTKLVLQAMPMNTSNRFDLFLDGYDEVNSAKLDTVDAFLRQLTKLSNFGIHMTTRPHWRPRLENLLNVISYEILPFNKSNQVEFLSRYWRNKLFLNGEEAAALHNYAEKCLATLNEYTNGANSEEEISGNPLHCWEIAKGFLGDIMRALNLGLETIKIRVDTIFGMYKTLVDAKFGNFSVDLKDPSSVIYWLKGSSRLNYVEAHVYESVALLFPDWIELFKPNFIGFEMDENELYSIGLIEKIPYINSRRFVHKIFAEYLLAEYLVKNLHKSSPFDQMVFGVILQSGEAGGKELGLQWRPFQTSVVKLKHSAISSFVNMHLRERTTNCSIDVFVLSIPKQPNEIHFKQLCEAIGVCVIQDLEFCLKLAIKLLRHLPFAYVSLTELIAVRDTYFKYLPHFAVERCNDFSNTLAIVLEFLKLEFGTQLSYHTYKTDKTADTYSWVSVLTPLHMAVYHGKFRMACHIVDEHGEEINKLKYLLHMCVRDSSNLLCEEEVNDKVAITHMLVRYAKRNKLNWVTEKLNGRKPSDEEHVHPRLLDRLLYEEKNWKRRFLDIAGMTFTDAFSQLSISAKPTSSQSSKNEDLIITKKLIGKGRNSEVYEGTFGDRIVAIKQIKVHQTENDIVKQEIQILIKCDDHDNIVQYLLFQCHGDSLGQIEYRIVMEFCESTLKEFVENRESSFLRLGISEETVHVELLRQMTEGISHLHGRKDQIIHRDLKPENILLKARHEKIVVKLADFGISKIIADGKTHHTSKDLAGTIDWIAPELLHALLNKKEEVRLTVKVDIFSLGCLFWYVLSNGKHPFARAPSSESEYQPKLEINALENQTLHCNILRLILFMISFHEKERPSIEDIKNHPIFWPAEKRLLFLTESIDSTSKHGQTQVENWLKINYQKLAGGSHSNFDRIFSKIKGLEKGWLGCLSEHIENALQNKKSKNHTKYKENSFIDLLTAIRNLKAHLREKEDSVKEEVGRSPDDFINYWHSPGRFPFLLDFLWTAFQSKEEPALKKYYEGVKFNFAKIMKKENQSVV